MADAYDPATMRAELERLKGEMGAIESRVAPLRQAYDELSRSSTAQLKAMADEFKAIEAPLPELKKKIATLVRAIGGRG